FSSRRRHTRFSRDWSSDVCSSDLDSRRSLKSFILSSLSSTIITVLGIESCADWMGTVFCPMARLTSIAYVTGNGWPALPLKATRSEERRVGKDRGSEATTTNVQAK